MWTSRHIVGTVVNLFFNFTTFICFLCILITTLLPFSTFLSTFSISRHNCFEWRLPFLWGFYPAFFVRISVSPEQCALFWCSQLSAGFLVLHLMWTSRHIVGTVVNLFFNFTTLFCFLCILITTILPISTFFSICLLKTGACRTGCLPLHMRSTW